MMYLRKVSRRHPTSTSLGYQIPTAVVLRPIHQCHRYQTSNLSMLGAGRPMGCQVQVVLPESRMSHLIPKLPKLQSSLHHTATRDKAMQISGTQGKHAHLVYQ